MKRLVKNILLRFSANAQFQRLLERNVVYSQYLMGIGSGSATDSSGEVVLVSRLIHGATANRPICVFDVGANKGQFLSLMAAGLQAVPFHIHAFEPSRSAYQILCDNFKDRGDVTLNNMGLGGEGGEVELYYEKPASGLASLSKRRLAHMGIEFKYSERVQIDTLDRYCLSHAIQRIDLLKLDVEGHELEVLRGGRQMFSNRQIRMVSFEFGGGNIDSRTYFQDFFYFFKEIGMGAMFRITPSGYLAPINRYQEVYEQFRTTVFLVLQDAGHS